MNVAYRVWYTVIYSCSKRTLYSLPELIETLPAVLIIIFWVNASTTGFADVEAEVIVRGHETFQCQVGRGVYAHGDQHIAFPALPGNIEVNEDPHKCSECVPE